MYLWRPLKRGLTTETMATCDCTHTVQSQWPRAWTAAYAARRRCL